MRTCLPLSLVIRLVLGVEGRGETQLFLFPSTPPSDDSRERGGVSHVWKDIGLSLSSSPFPLPSLPVMKEQEGGLISCLERSLLPPTPLPPSLACARERERGLSSCLGKSLLSQPPFPLPSRERIWWREKESLLHIWEHHSPSLSSFPLPLMREIGVDGGRA